MRVLIVDDSAELRMLLELVVAETAPSWVVAGTAGDGREAITRAAELLPDLVLLDASMPVLDGLHALPDLRRAAPDAVIVMLTAFPGERLKDAALAAGASGIIEKTRLVDELVPSIERILRAARL